MKKILIAAFGLSVIGYFSCNKNDDPASVPVACFTASGLDSSKVATLSQATIDSIIKVQAPGYFINVDEGTPVKIYKRMLVIRYCGSVSNFKSLYTGDASHIFVDPSNPGNVTTAQYGVNFPNNYFVYSYSAAGTYPVTVVSSNVSFTGKDLKRNVVTKTITLQ
jgi:hypothetical protein